MKRLTLVLAIMVTGLSFAQDLSSFTVTDTVKRYKDVKDGVWTQTPDRIVNQFTSSNNTIDDFNAVINNTLEILEDNRSDLYEWGDDTANEFINEVKNRYSDEFENLFEATKLGSGLAREYKIVGEINTVIISLILYGDNFVITIRS